MERYVTDLATSKKLKEAGIQGHHHYHWLEFSKLDSNDKDELRLGMAPCDSDIHPAYFLSELLEMVDGTIDMQFSKGRTYITRFGKNSTGVPTITSMSCESIINTVAEAIIYQKEQTTSASLPASPELQAQQTPVSPR